MKIREIVELQENYIKAYYIVKGISPKANNRDGLIYIDKLKSELEVYKKYLLVDITKVKYVCNELEAMSVLCMDIILGEIQLMNTYHLR